MFDEKHAAEVTEKIVHNMKEIACIMKDDEPYFLTEIAFNSALRDFVDLFIEALSHSVSLAREVSVQLDL